MSSFPHLFQPIRIGKIEVRNRLFFAPTVTFMADNGSVSALTYEFYDTLAKGGFGLVTVEPAHIREDGGVGLEDRSSLAGATEQDWAGLAQLADVMHRHDLPASIQLLHAGRGAIGRYTGWRPVAPSDTPPEGGVIEWPPGGDNKPRALSTKEVVDLIDAFVLAALRAKKAGYDMALFQGTHGWIFNQFQARYTNHRTDRYGDPVAFTVEVIKRCRAAVGPHFGLGLRMSGDDYFAGGITLDQSTRMAPQFVAAGLDWLDVSAGTKESRHRYIQPLYYPRGTLVDLAHAIKQVVDVPVVTAGRINDPRLAEDILAKGRADIVAVSRAALADPEFARKAQEGRLDEIRGCMACDQCLPIAPEPFRCAVNFRLGRPRGETEIQPAAVVKMVLVVGGGVAGMEFARVARLRGHEVTLCEREDRLGGAVEFLASRIPRLNTHDLRNSVQWLSSEMERLGVRVILGREADVCFVEQQKPDVVVLATGSELRRPKIPGIDGNNVLMIDEYLRHPRKIGPRVVVLGAQHGIETALSLARDGVRVTVVDEGSNVYGAPYMRLRRMLALQEFMRDLAEEMRPTVLINTTVKAIHDGYAVITDRASLAQERAVEANAVVVALARVPNDRIKGALVAKAKELHVVGDCNTPHNILAAIIQASDLGRRI